MADENIYEKAEAFVRRNWEVHRQAFGPILEPAFSEDPQARLLLIHALNHISKKQVKPGVEILKQLQGRCNCNADRAALAFFHGLAFEMVGVTPQMIQWYEKAGQLGHRFFLPHLKLSKAYHNAASYDNARKHYQIAIEYLKASEDPDGEILASAYTNLCSCLTMMHLFTEAKKAWEQAQKYPMQPGAYAAGAMLYAVLGDKEKLEEMMAILKNRYPAWVKQTQQNTQDVLAHTHPHFNKVPVEPERIQAFWQWFRENEDAFDQNVAKILPELAKQIREAFPFLHRPPSFRASKGPKGKQIAFCDFYAVSLHYGYGALLTQCPPDILSRWTFTIIH